MRIGLNAQLLPPDRSYRAAGVASYVRQLTERLPRVAPENEYVFFAPRGMTGKNIRPSRFDTSNPLIRIPWEQVVEPVLVSRLGLDVVHSPVNVSPVLMSASSVVTVHDLGFMLHPEVFPAAKRYYLQAMVRRSVRSARQVIAPSLATADDITEQFGVPPDRISVIPEGVDERFRVEKDSPRPLAEPYILYVGTIEPRKNLPVLIRAFASIREAGYPHRLALVGGNGWMYEDVYGLIDELGMKEAIITTGFVEDLVPWYNHADLFVYPSMFEGFGLPPLEALACGTPVVASSARSLREVVGEAAVYFALDDEDDVVTALRRVIDDRLLAERLRTAGLERASLFSWDDTVRRTAAVYELAAQCLPGSA